MSEKKILLVGAVAVLGIFLLSQKTAKSGEVVKTQYGNYNTLPSGYTTT